MGWAEALVLVLLAAVLVLLTLVWRTVAQRRVEAVATEPPRAPVEAGPDPLDEQRLLLQQQDREVHERRREIDAQRRELDQQQLEIEQQRLVLDQERLELDQRRRDAEAETERLLAAQQEVLAQQESASSELERIAGLDAATARTEVLARVEHEARLEAAALTRDIEREARDTAQQRARKVVVTAIQRLASEQTTETTVSSVDLPSDEMKGRIIGREGRNIRAFEQVTGVNLMIDDTPGLVLLSAFDPVRRAVARLTLEELVADGRIHPQRIEEVHARSERAIADHCLEAAEDALLEVGISDLHPELKPVLGALRYRTSYGQNVLAHLVECAHLAALMATELGLDPTLAKRGAFLHDIGKALTHQSEGSHALVGADLARRHGEHPDVVHAIEAHHNEVEPTTVEALLTQAADAISGSRPAARRESLEAYVQRLEQLEQIGLRHEGVDRVFAMQAGREVRVMVLPEVVDDAGADALAREIAREISDELTFPGQIRVTVVRESRATQVAH
ncbi:ribonuclease Y [Aestuariimicrobium ganziense]|uniref:ribonuclease Y n=1 Tax=Aestuariimicrobium ganziense TaxID=2773677 RepID=UPI001941AE48|nr:ribonuclease Y [Aestuariimicrobium ganziense]